MTNRQYAQQKLYDNMRRYLVTCIAAADLTDGEFFYYHNGSVDYYIWFDKVGDESGDPSANPNLTGKTGVAVDISAASTNITVATALVTAIDALSNSSAFQKDEVVYITQVSEENDANMEDYNTTMTISSDGYLASEEFPRCSALTLYRRRMYGNMIKYIPGTPNTTEYGDTLLDIEYRGVELMMDKEEARHNKEAGAQFVPSDYIYNPDRMKLPSMGTGFTRGTGH